MIPMRCPCRWDIKPYKGNDRPESAKPRGWDCANGCFIYQVILTQPAMGYWVPNTT